MKEYFPDGSQIDSWFYDTSVPTLDKLGKQYVITDYGIKDDGKIYTEKFQEIIDLAAFEGGGVLVVPKGVFMSGALFFRQGVNLYISKDGVLKGSDDISDYPVIKTRIEGESCMYYPALVNADNVDGFVISGEGTIDGNGLKAWKAFWQRRAWNPACTNKDEQRPRLVYISNSKNVTVAGLRLINSHFWTNHVYKSKKVRFLNCYIYSPKEPVKAPSTDAIDLDVCKDVLIKGCYMEVNDDSVVLKGGKGPYADEDPDNGINERILVEDCKLGFCHGCLTCGSESVNDKNILVRRLEVKDVLQLLWLKMRPDTPQHYSYIRMEDVKAENITNFIDINPWTQFFDLKGREDIPLSFADHICLKNISCSCETFFNVHRDDTQYRLSDFELENLDIKAKNFGEKCDSFVKCKNITFNGERMDFLKIFHIDNGRKYFSLDELKDIVSVLSANGYNMMEIAPSNGGMRFLLDDMSVRTSLKTYDSAEVKAAIDTANKHFCDSRENELSEKEMEELLSFAYEKGIQIMPLVNSPGHMEALTEAMEILGIENVRYRGSCDTINFESVEAVDFTREFVKKYIKWFADHGCHYFNMGCDEYANDVLTSGFADLCRSDAFRYDKFINYVNEMADLVLAAGMTPVMYNDGMYYDKCLAGGKLNPSIVCSYWTEGWPGYTPAPAEFVKAQGHKIINTCCKWYYVLGRRPESKNPLFCDEQSLEGLATHSKHDVLGGISGEPVGAMFCLWTDEPDAPYDASERALLVKMLAAF